MLPHVPGGLPGPRCGLGHTTVAADGSSGVLPAAAGTRAAPAPADRAIGGGDRDDAAQHRREDRAVEREQHPASTAGLRRREARTEPLHHGRRARPRCGSATPATRRRASSSRRGGGTGRPRATSTRQKSSASPTEDVVGVAATSAQTGAADHLVGEPAERPQQAEPVPPAPAADAADGALDVRRGDVGGHLLAVLEHGPAGPVADPTAAAGRSAPRAVTPLQRVGMSRSLTCEMASPIGAAWRRACRRWRARRRCGR